MGIHFYKNGNYSVAIMSDGTKVRSLGNDSEFRPEFAENVDVLITKKCSIGCSWCYENCTKNGIHADLLKYDVLLSSLHPYTEMAINGNDLDHPQLDKFLEILKDRKVYANITVHYDQFMKNYVRLRELSDCGLIHGIGISWSGVNDPLFLETVSGFRNAVIHLIAGIVRESDIDFLGGNDLNLLFLGYKDLGRGNIWSETHTHTLQRRIGWLSKNIGNILNCRGKFKAIGFDNLAIEQLGVQKVVDPEIWKEYYMGNDGKFTFYLDLVNGKFSKNSVSLDRFNIEPDMKIDDMFNIIREKYEKD